MNIYFLINEQKCTLYFEYKSTLRLKTNQRGYYSIFNAQLRLSKIFQPLHSTINQFYHFDLIFYEKKIALIENFAQIEFLGGKNKFALIEIALIEARTNRGIAVVTNLFLVAFLLSIFNQIVKLLGQVRLRISKLRRLRWQENVTMKS